MNEKIIPPFSARNSGARVRVDNDFPESARIGLLYLLDRLVEKKYISSWTEFARELQRIGRVRIDFEDFHDVRDDTSELMLRLEWRKVFDFCERLYTHLVSDAWGPGPDTGEREILFPKADIQQYIAREMQQLFLEEHFGFEYSNGVVRRQGRRALTDQIARAEFVLGDPRLSKSLAHYNKALKYFRNVSSPDPENVVKEAVCSVEAAGRALFPSAGNTLGEVVKSITGSEVGQLPRSVAKTFDGIYGFRNSGEGVGHGGSDGGVVTNGLAEYALAIAASQIVLLVDVAAAAEQDVPF